MKNLSKFFTGLVLILILIPGCNDQKESDSAKMELFKTSRVGATTFSTGIFVGNNPDINDWVDDGSDGSVNDYSIPNNVNFSNNTFYIDWMAGYSYGFCYSPGWAGAPEEINYKIPITGFWSPEGGATGLYGWLDGSDGYTEFYIVETVGSVEGPHNNNNDGDYPIYVGSYECDGCTYDFYTHMRYGKPNPRGESEFMQWIAVNRRVNPGHPDRNDNPESLYPRLSGTISLAEHMDTWETDFAKTHTNVDWTVYSVEAWVSGNTSSTTRGKASLEFTANPVEPETKHINILADRIKYPDTVMYMNGTSLSSSSTIDNSNSNAHFIMYTLCMTQTTTSGWTRGARVVAFKNNNGKFLTVNFYGNVVESSISDWKDLTDNEKFVYDDNYCLCDFRSLRNYNSMDVNGQCHNGNVYGNFSIREYVTLGSEYSGGKKMTVADNSSYSSILSQSENPSWTSQHWQMETLTGDAPSSGDTVRLRNLWSGKYLTVTNVSDYADVRAQNLNTSWTSQEWVIEGDLSQARFRNVWSGKYLTATSPNECSAIKCQPLNYSWSSQLWNFQN